MSVVDYDFRPALAAPVVVCAFTGWNDGGEAASTAAAYLRDRWGARRFARIDPEEFYDFQITRPTVRLVDGVTRQLDWPANEFLHARTDGRDIVLLIGVEPNLRWRSFARAVVSVARDLDASMLVTLGAFLTDVPHTMPAPVAVASPDPRLAARLGAAPSRYEGPTGIVGVLHDVASDAGMTSVSLWAAVPHYLPGEANPKAALTLLGKLQDVLGVPIETDTIVRAAAAWETRVAEMIADNAELADYVRSLEDSAQEQEEIEDIPSGDALADELERFLRDERGDDKS